MEALEMTGERAERMEEERKWDVRKDETIARETEKSTTCRGAGEKGLGNAKMNTKSAARAVKSLALITEGSKENDGSRYSIMFLWFARKEGETVYLCY